MVFKRLIVAIKKYINKINKSSLPKCYYGYIGDLKNNDDRIQYFTDQLFQDGFDDTETWSLETTFAKWILPRLKRFKEIEGFKFDEFEGFREAIDVMIEGFEIVALDKGMLFGEDEEKVDRAFEEFSQWHAHLWW